MIYVAVVAKLWNRSQWPEGQWACFVDKNKNAAIRQAVHACDKWMDKGYGPYDILVGTLTEEVLPPIPSEFRLMSITDMDFPRWTEKGSGK